MTFCCILRIYSKFESMTKETLIEMKNGDEESFRTIVMESQRPLYSFIVKFVADEVVARDLLQDTYIRIWKHRRRYNEDHNFLTWALSIAANICKDYLRRNKIRKASAIDKDVLSDLLQYDADIENVLTNQEWAAVIRALIPNIGSKQRLVFTLGCLEGYDNEEIHEITGLSSSQIKSNLYAAKQKIREKLKNMGYE